MALPVIAYKSHFRFATGTITDPGSETGYPIANLHDLRSYTVWKSSSLASPINIDLDVNGILDPASYIMLVNHNLHTLGATVEVFGDTVNPPVTSRVSFSPAEDTVSYKEFASSGVKRYWRVQITKGGGFASAPFIGELFVGPRMELPQYLAPSFDPFFKQVEVHGARSRGGHYLGASLRGQTHRGEITFGEAGTPRADFTASLNAFLDDHAYKRYPFGFVVDTADGDFDDCRYLKVPDDADIQRRSVGGTWQNLTFVLPVEEAYAEPA